MDNDNAEVGNSLQEIRERAEAATPGPWSVVAGDGDGFYLCAAYPDDPGSASNDMIIATFNDVQPDHKQGYKQSHRNALLACYARTDIPYLLSLNEALVERVRVLEVALGNIVRLVKHYDRSAEPAELWMDSAEIIAALQALEQPPLDPMKEG